MMAHHLIQMVTAYLMPTIQTSKETRKETEKVALMVVEKVKMEKAKAKVKDRDKAKVKVKVKARVRVKDKDKDKGRDKAKDKAKVKAKDKGKDRGKAKVRAPVKVKVKVKVKMKAKVRDKIPDRMASRVRMDKDLSPVKTVSKAKKTKEMVKPTSKITVKDNNSLVENREVSKPTKPEWIKMEIIKMVKTNSNKEAHSPTKDSKVLSPTNSKINSWRTKTRTVKTTMMVTVSPMI
jgi:hypothetical protein